MGSKKEIKDSFGRVHDYLRISLTERCNLRCFYCMPEEGVQLRDKAEFMTAEETIGIARAFVERGVKKIRLTGGEPLIKKNAEMIIRELGKMPIELTLTTNAVAVDRYIDVLKEVGVKSLNVSMDSLKAERFNAISRRSYFDQIMKNIHLLKEEQFEVKINVVLIRGVNDDEIIDFIEWSRETGLDIRFIEFMPFDGNNWNRDKTISYEEIMVKVKSHYGNSIIKSDDGENSTSRNYHFKNSKGSFGIISSVTNPFCDSCNRIRLTADGKIKNCLFSNDEMDLLSAFRAGKELDKLIDIAMKRKFKVRAGINELTDEEISAYQNRSMTAIGG